MYMYLCNDICVYDVCVSNTCLRPRDDFNSRGCAGLDATVYNYSDACWALFGQMETLLTPSRRDGSVPLSDGVGGPLNPGLNPCKCCDVWVWVCDNYEGLCMICAVGLCRCT